jgi:hypothetical protein
MKAAACVLLIDHQSLHGLVAFNVKFERIPIHPGRTDSCPIARSATIQLTDLCKSLVAGEQYHVTGNSIDGSITFYGKFVYSGEELLSSGIVGTTGIDWPE